MANMKCGWKVWVLNGLLMLWVEGCRPPEPPSSTVAITSDTFSEVVANDPGLVVVDFWATWCGPCRRVSPILEKLGAEYRGRVKFGKVDVEENQDLAEQFRIKYLPSLILFKGGKAAEMLVGAHTEEFYRSWLNGYLSPDRPDRPTEPAS